MNFIQVARIGCLSAAIIDSAAQAKLDICKQYYQKYYSNRLKDRTQLDKWMRLCWAFSYESRFYRQGLDVGFGIKDLFEALFEVEGVDQGVDWDSIVIQKVLRPLTFKNDPGQELRAIPYKPQPFEPESDEQALAMIEVYLLEEIRRGVALAHWTDAQIDDKDKHDPEAVAIWEQIIDQAKRFYSYAEGCEAKIGHQREELTFVSAGGVFAVNEFDLPPEVRPDVEFLSAH